MKPTKSLGPSNDIRQFLLEYYRDDVALLESLFGFKTPWEEFSRKAKK